MSGVAHYYPAEGDVRFGTRVSVGHTLAIGDVCLICGHRDTDHARFRRAGPDEPWRIWCVDCLHVCESVDVEARLAGLSRATGTSEMRRRDPGSAPTQL